MILGAIIIVILSTFFAIAFYFDKKKDTDFTTSSRLFVLLIFTVMLFVVFSISANVVEKRINIIRSDTSNYDNVVISNINLTLNNYAYWQKAFGGILSYHRGFDTTLIPLK